MSHSLLWVPRDLDGTAFEIQLQQGYVGTCFTWGVGRWVWHILHKNQCQLDVFAGSGTNASPQYRGFAGNEFLAKEAVERQARILEIMP